jgi:phage tail sheath protein FI
VSGLLGSTPHHNDEWSPTEAGNTLIAAADELKYTTQFLNETSLGANDAARRVSVVTALQAAINSNTNIRGETYEYNLILCPGFPEVVDEMLALSTDVLEEAFVIADTPFNLSPEDVVTWGATIARQSSTNVAYYYPHGIASNLDGQNVFIAASGTALRTICYSDNVANVWIAPAGARRGIVTGVSQVGYVTGTLGTATTFVEADLNQGQRDNLYKYFTNINPIVFFPGRGILIWGQKTSANAASALDRINVVRLIMYVRRQLRKNAMPFVFEPNDQLTRDNLKAAVDGFLGDLIVKRGLYDFATVCDDSNNTPDRIDRNEMYIDIALKPVKAAEFIYIPIRVVNTGTSIA